jgi:multiple sugar transport system substrate-binding protein
MLRVAGALAAVGGTVALAACAPGQGSKAAPAQVSGKVVLWSVAQFRFDQDVGADFIRELELQNPGLQITPEVPAGDRFQKLLAAAAADSAPDIGQAGSWQMQEVGAVGVARPLDGYLKVSSVVKQADLWPALVKDLVWKGQQYGMPFGPDIALMYVNSNTLRAAGVDADKPAQTWDQLQQHIARIYRAEPFRLGFHPLQGQGGPRTWFVNLWQLGGEAISADGTKITLANNEPAIKALELTQAVVRAQGTLEGMYAGVLAAGGTSGVVGAFANGAVGYLYETLDQPVKDPFKSAAGLQFGVISFPLPPQGKRVSIGGCHSFCVTAQSKVPDAAWRVLEHLANDVNNLRFAQAYNRIPIRVSTAKSAAFHKNDPLLKLSVDEMTYRRFWLAAPGGTEMQGIYSNVATNVVTGKASIRDALADTEKQLQAVLDKWKR